MLASRRWQPIDYRHPWTSTSKLAIQQCILCTFTLETSSTARSDCHVIALPPLPSFPATRHSLHHGSQPELSTIEKEDDREEHKSGHPGCPRPDGVLTLPSPISGLVMGYELHAS
jgi:hypothetical protein